MLVKLLASPLLTFDSMPHFHCLTSDSLKGSFSNNLQPTTVGGRTLKYSPNKWALYSTARIGNINLNDDEKESWEACREALSAFKFSSEEEYRIIGKAFGQIHSPYWGEERKKKVPELKIVNEILQYLRSLSLTDEDLTKLLKKFPEVIGCSLEQELQTNIQLLEKEWGIKGKSLRNLLLRNPKVLGYNIDCKGDCMAQCTRCWVRF